jgi:CTP synthase (UTP-ammonia lyase)
MIAPYRSGRASRCSTLEPAALAVTAPDHDGEARILGLPHHRFFVGTLFVPRFSGTRDGPRPRLAAFVVAASGPERPDSRTLASATTTVRR